MQDRDRRGRRGQRLLGRALVVALAALPVLAFLPWSAAPADAGSNRTLVFTPVADTYVDASTPATAYGGVTQIVADATPLRESYLRFQVSGVTGSVVSATLRLHTTTDPNAGSPAGGQVARMSAVTWDETTVTYNSRPAIDGPVSATFGAVGIDQWYQADVTSAVTGNGTVSLGLRSSSSDGAYYLAREAGALAPRLVVTYDPNAATLVGAGDIASCSSSGDEATAALLDGLGGTVFTTGDNVYSNGTATEFANCYDPSWGRHRTRTRPAPGNHDYNTANAAPYFDYFTVQVVQRLQPRGSAQQTLGTQSVSLAGTPGQGWYSYELGSWHVVVLNSNCASVGGCQAGSAQEQWLRQDLAAHPVACTVAYWHHPLFSSGSAHGGSTITQALFQALYDYGAELVLTGHEHNYERFAPQTATGSADPAHGIREFVVGTGGASHYGFGATKPNSEVRNGDTYGVLKLTLRTGGYDWRFVPEAGKSFADSGSGTCH